MLHAIVEESSMQFVVSRPVLNCAIVEGANSSTGHHLNGFRSFISKMCGSLLNPLIFCTFILVNWIVVGNPAKETKGRCLSKSAVDGAVRLWQMRVEICGWHFRHSLVLQSKLAFQTRFSIAIIFSLGRDVSI
jgi:hypothetical protein